MSSTHESDQYSIIGFSISPSQTLDANEKGRLQGDIISLLSSLTYQPENISKITLDLRYFSLEENSLARKRLDIILLVRIDFDQGITLKMQNEVLLKFKNDFCNLLNLNLNPYEFRLELLNNHKVGYYFNPFTIENMVEITRRIVQYKPFQYSNFKGNSPMTKIVDMLLRESGQHCFSVLLQPHIMTEKERYQMEVYGYQSGLIPTDIDKELLEHISGLQAQSESMFTCYRMKIRLVSDTDISQYLVNLIGSEISGHTNFFHLKPNKSDFKSEINSFSKLEFTSILSNIIQLEIPNNLLELIYLFRPENVVTAFRLPTERISVSKEKTFKTYMAPITQLPSSGVFIGTGEHPSIQEPISIYIQPKDRKRHMYIIGMTGTGKSKMLLNMLIQDVKSNGLCLIDPHGDLYESVFAYIPEERKDDVYLFDPSDREYVLGFNILETTLETTKAEKDYIVQELISILLRLVEYDIGFFGPIAQQWTRFACLTIMAIPGGGTLIDVPRLFTDTEFQKSVLDKVKDPFLLDWWKKEYESLSSNTKSEMLNYFTSKFTPLVSAPQVANMIGQIRSGLNLKKILDEKKILLVNLSKGKIGQNNSALIGTLLMSRILWTVLTRAWEREEERQEFYLYVDEFQNFITDTFETILSEARKYGLNLIVAHQHLGQLKAMTKLGDKIERAVFGNVGTIVSFRLGTDATTIVNELGEPVEEATLRNLERRYAACKLLVNEAPSVPFTMRTTEWIPPNPQERERGERIKEAARKRGKKISEIEKEISSSYI